MNIFKMNWKLLKSSGIYINIGLALDLFPFEVLSSVKCSFSKIEIGLGHIQEVRYTESYIASRARMKRFILC